MTILIITTKDHPYAQLVLLKLFQTTLFHTHRVIIWEQNTIIPGKSLFSGLYIYLKSAGLWYVFWEAYKQYSFLLVRFFVRLLGVARSPWFPYEHFAPKNFVKETVNQINAQEAVEKMRILKPDILISIYSREIIGPSVLSIPRFGAVNLHPSYLPFYRGISPVFWALSEGSRGLGVTIHYIDDRIDTGPIIFQRKFSIVGYHSEHELFVACSREGATLLSTFLRDFIKHPRKFPSKTKRKKSMSYRSIPTRNAVEEFRRRGFSILQPLGFFYERT